MPYLEATEDWPTDSRGEKLRFVAQINFAELTSVRSPAPRCGIYVLFFGPDEPYYRWLWYAEPKESADVTGPSIGNWEWRLNAEATISLDLRRSPASRLPEFHLLSEWLESEGGNLGAWTEATLDGPGPREWFCGKPEPGGRWVQLWAQSLEESYGSMETSVVVRLDDFESGDLGRCRVISWQ